MSDNQSSNQEPVVLQCFLNAQLVLLIQDEQGLRITRKDGKPVCDPESIKQALTKGGTALVLTGNDDVLSVASVLARMVQEELQRLLQADESLSDQETLDVSSALTNLRNVCRILRSRSSKRAQDYPKAV